MQNLNTRTALVTGAAGGIGRQIVRALLRARTAVVATDVTTSGLSTLTRAMAAEGLADRLVTRELDIADYGACADAVQATHASFGMLDILINNAAVGMGVIRDDHMSNLVAIEEITPQLWDRFVA